MLDGEKQLILRAIKGEAQAFGLLYDRYQPQIYRFIYLKVSHREEAEDLTHQVFLKSWERISEYRDQGFPFSSWLYRIARNEIIDHYRTKKIAYSLEFIDNDDSPELETENEAVEIIDIVLDIERVKKAIGKLKPLEQDVLVLRFVEDLPPAEVAEIIERTPESARLIQHRALKNLKKIINTEAQNG